MQRSVRFLDSFSDSFPHPLRQARFADARLSCNQHHLARAAAGLLPTLFEQRRLIFASYQRRNFDSAMRGLEAAFHPSRFVQAPRLHRVFNSLQRVPSQIGERECVAQQAPGGRRNHDLTGIGQRLQTSRQVRRFSHRETGFSAAVGRISSNNHWTRREADANRKWPARRHGLDRIYDFERRADSAFRGILISNRPAKIYQNPVAQVLGHMPRIA